MTNFFKKNFGLCIVIILGSLPLFPLLHIGLPITHDGQDHVARIANFYLSLSEGNIIPRWAANLNWGYGHPILMFLYPFPSYFVSTIHVFGFSIVDSLKIVFGLSFVLSGVCMYMWIRNLMGEKAGIVAGVLYMFAPYRFVDLYVRGAIGEHVAFLFVPLVFYAIYKVSLVKKRANFYPILLSLAIAGLILSHNAISIMFLPLIILYCIIHIYFSDKKVSLGFYYIVFIFLGLGLSSFFLLPAFFEGKYTLRDIVTGSNEYVDRFVSLSDYINLSWSFGGSDLLSKQIGTVQLLGVVISLFIIKKTKGFVRLTSVLFLVALVVSLFIMLPQSNFIWQAVSTLQKFQFPWRFMFIVVFLSAFLSALSLTVIKNKHISTGLCVVFCLLAVVLYLPYYNNVQGYLEKPERFYTGIYKSTTDTGESAPIWSVRFMEKEPNGYYEVIDGNAKIKLNQRNTTSRNYEIDVKSEVARIRENTLYFPNWKVYINEENALIEFQDPANRGLITYKVNKGKNNVKIVFEDTKLRTVSNYITLISLLLLIVFSVYIIRKK